jgi:hypothetical protein
MALANPSDEMRQKNELPCIGGAFRQTDRYKSGHTFKFEKLDWSAVDLKQLRSAIFQLEPDLSKEYDTWHHKKLDVEG